MKYSFLYGLLFVSSIVFSQDSFRKLTRDGEKAFKNGDFVVSSLKSSQALLQNPTFKKAIVLFENAIKVVYGATDQKIKSLQSQAIPYQNISSADKLEEMIALLHQMQSVRNAAALLGQVRFKTISSPLDYGRDYTADIAKGQTLLGEYRTKAAEELYILASTQYNNAQSKEQILEASKNFNRVNTYVANYKNAREMEIETQKVFDEMAAAEYYNQALSIYQRAVRKQDFQEAYIVFSKIENHVNNYRNAQELKQKALIRGTYHVAFMVPPRKHPLLPLWNEIYQNMIAQTQGLPFVKVVQAAVSGVYNIKVLISYLESQNNGIPLDHLYSLNLERFDVFPFNRNEVEVAERTRTIKRKGNEIELKGNFSKINTTVGTEVVAFMEVINAQTFRPDAVLDLSRSAGKTHTFWIHNSGDFKAFKRGLNLVDPLVRSENEHVNQLVEQMARQIKSDILRDIAHEQAALYQ